MLQHNAARETEPRPAKGPARRAHLAHAAVVGSHLVCCGAPIALAFLATGAGASIGVSAAAEWMGGVHLYLHAHELWILAASALFVTIGGFLELRGRKPVSWLFALSALCFLANAAFIGAHWTAG